MLMSQVMVSYYFNHKIADVLPG